MPVARLKMPGKAGRPAPLRLLLAAALGLAALAFLGFRVYQSARSAPPSAPRLLLGEDVALEAPPPLPPGDQQTVQAGLRQVRELQAAAQAQGSAPSAHLEAAQAATRIGDLLSARAEIRAALAHNPQPPPPVISDVLARCEAQLGLFSEAIRTYDDLIARAPGSAIGYIGLSRVQFLLGQRQEALRTLERGSGAVAASDIQGRLALVSEFEARAEVQRALKEAQAVAGAAPEEPAAKVAVARLLGKLGRLTEARQMLEKVLAAHPDHAEALSALADLLLNPLLPKSDPAAIEQTLLRAGQNNPRDTASFTRLGAFYQELGHYRQAAYVYTRLLTRAPDSAVGRLQLAYAYARLGDTRASAEQQQIANRLLARDQEEARLVTRRDAHPRDPAARLALAHHYIGAGQFASALIELQAAYCLAPGSAPVRRELNAFYTRLGVPPPGPLAGAVK
ncbi:MAG TPA: tetratricopeptide repeat protein [Chthonomonadaceae bacterium]|nr:tetratricopeptide repeat protein [Chthonomonadaceae bacterium]